MSIQRKRYFAEGDKWFCETSIYHEDTQNTPTAWVREVSKDEVPADLLPPAPPALPSKRGAK